MSVNFRESMEGRVRQVPLNDNWGVTVAEMLLAGASEQRFTDLHLQSRLDGVMVRGRREGSLEPIVMLAKSHQDLLIARLKVLARLPAFVRHEPQDGRIDWRTPDGGETMGLRVSFLPTLHGESVVIRFPEGGGGKKELQQLGMNEAQLAATRNLLRQPEGMILTTGPSGSGKTTTLYAMLRELHRLESERLNFVTIEDPIECDLGFASQVSVNEAQGVTFDRALRSALRQDPNVLLIGEIRDLETARIAVQAGMTGHLVFSTLHAGRVGRVFSRLLSMGLEPFLVASAMTGAIAQRLQRRSCPHCRAPLTETGTWKASGCEQCDYTGHSGRIPLFEIVVVGENIRNLIMQGAAPNDLISACAERMVGNLVNDAAELSQNGELSREEANLLLMDEELRT